MGRPGGGVLWGGPGHDRGPLASGLSRRVVGAPLAAGRLPGVYAIVGNRDAACPVIDTSATL